MSKDLEVLKADVKKLMLKDWTNTEITKLDEFMEDVIIATMRVNKLPIHIVVRQSEQLKAFNDWFDKNWYPEEYSYAAIEAYLKSL